MLAYLFTQREVHSTTVKESLKPRLELGAQTHDALRPACPTSSGKCPEIQRLPVPGGKEVKISQYADDNTCIVTNSYGLVKVIDVFNEYGRASGARLNTTKSKGLWLGRWRSRTDSPCGLTWVNTSLKIVGIYFHWFRKCKDPIMGRCYGQIQGHIEEMGTTVSDVMRENDGDWEFGGFDALACGKDIPANA
jgi:hypothetical protein